MNKRQDGILNVCRKLFPNRTNVKEELYPLDDYVRFLGVLESKDVDSRPNRAENILAIKLQTPGIFFGRYDDPIHKTIHTKRDGYCHSQNE